MIKLAQKYFSCIFVVAICFMAISAQADDSIDCNTTRQTIKDMEGKYPKEDIHKLKLLFKECYSAAELPPPLIGDLSPINPGINTSVGACRYVRTLYEQFKRNGQIEFRERVKQRYHDCF